MAASANNSQDSILPNFSTENFSGGNTGTIHNPSNPRSGPTIEGSADFGKPFSDSNQLQYSQINKPAGTESNLVTFLLIGLTIFLVWKLFAKFVPKMKRLLR